MKNSVPTYNWLFNSLFLLLAAMSVYFFKERLFVDSSYMIFKTINEGWFHIEHGRPAHGITQVLPLIGYALHLPLKYLLILYSLGQVFFFFLVNRLLTRVLKQHAASIALVGLMLIGQSWLYYIPMLEIVIGGALAVLVLSLMRTEKWKDDKWLVLLLISYWFVLSSHPLNYLTALVILVYDIADRGLNKKLHFSMLTFFLAAVFIEWLGHDSYEAQKVVALKDSGLKNLLSYDFLKKGLLLFVKSNWLVLIVGIWTTAAMFKRKKDLSFLIWPLSLLLLFAGAVYRWDISSDNWYTELVFQPLVSISLILFSFEIIDRSSQNAQKNWKHAFGLIYLAFAIAIAYNSSYMTDRVNQMERLTDHLQYQNSRKALIDLNNIERPYNNWEWSVPVEALLLSSIDGPNEGVSMITEVELDYNFNRKELGNSDLLFRMFEIIPYSELNPRYFQFEEGGYELVNSRVNEAEVKGMANKISIQPIGIDTIYKVQAGKEEWIDVSIQNEHYKKLPSSLETNLYIAPHWFHADTSYRWDGKRTPLELDIIGEHRQQIKILAPEETGIYEIQFDVVKEGEYWLGLKEKYLVQVY